LIRAQFVHRISTEKVAFRQQFGLQARWLRSGSSIGLSWRMTL
jgi:hypothetical protein